MQKSELDFISQVKKYYTFNKRHFPWRETADPYKILVSEVMLQQTQTARVIPKYLQWLDAFPTIEALAKASLSEVLTLWVGLGYNRRAKFLLECAKTVSREYKGTLPVSLKELRELPGIGDYTANALLAFAWEQPVILVETNIRTAIIHHFFSTRNEPISDTEIKEVLEKVLDRGNPRDWYYALMDYGNWLKSEGIDYFHKQKHYQKQPAFKGSERFVRGYLIREITAHGEVILKTLKIIGYTKKQIRKVADKLIAENLLKEISPGTLQVV